MTTQKLFKRRVRERMAKTGESYTAARRHAARTRDRITTARMDFSGATELASDQRILEVTGRTWETWLSLLDRWGARQRKRTDMVGFLKADQGVPGWWAQTIAGGYERVRGIRLKHQQADGFTIYASRTIRVPLTDLFDAFVDERTRRRWLTDGSMRLRSSRGDRTAARFDWGDGATRVGVTLDAKSPTRTTASVAHERLPDPEAAEAAKTAWKQRLSTLKGILEATDV
jgi:hypothetical protein